MWWTHIFQLDTTSGGYRYFNWIILVVDTGISIGAREALAYISWLVNANKLYDVALTTYDFELVTLVASQT